MEICWVDRYWSDVYGWTYHTRYKDGSTKNYIGVVPEEVQKFVETAFSSEYLLDNAGRPFRRFIR